MTRKLVLAVVDGLKPAMLERAVATGRAPAMKAVIEGAGEEQRAEAQADAAERRLARGGLQARAC